MQIILKSWRIIIAHWNIPLSVGWMTKARKCPSYEGFVKISNLNKRQQKPERLNLMSQYKLKLILPFKIYISLHKQMLISYKNIISGLSHVKLPIIPWRQFNATSTCCRINRKITFTSPNSLSRLYLFSCTCQFARPLTE